MYQWPCLRLQNELQNMVQVSMEEEEEEEGEEDALEDALLQDDDSNSKDMPSEWNKLIEARIN